MREDRGAGSRSRGLVAGGGKGDADLLKRADAALYQLAESAGRNLNEFSVPSATIHGGAVSASRRSTRQELPNDPTSPF